MSGSDADAYHQMKQEQKFKEYNALANSMNAPRNRGIPPQVLYRSLTTGTSIPETSSIKLTPEEIEKKIQEQDLKAFLQTQADYNSRQAAAAAAAGPKSQKSPKGPKSPKGSEGSGSGSGSGGGRIRRRTSSGTYRRRPNRARSSRRSRARK